MSGQKLNVLRLIMMMMMMILCCLTGLINSSEKILIGPKLPGPCLHENKKNWPDIKICFKDCKQQIQNYICAINASLNTPSIGHCQKDHKEYSLNINFVGDHHYEVKMNQTYDIELMVFPMTCTLKQILCSENTVTCAINTITNCPKGGCDDKIPSVKIKDKCEKATYNATTCSGGDLNKYILRSDGTNWVCEICENIPRKNITIVGLTDNKGWTNPLKAVEAMKILESQREDMEQNNITKAAVDMGNVTALLYLQAKNTETRDTCFFSDLDTIDDGDCQSYLNRDLPWSLKIPSEAFNKSRQKNNGSGFVVIVPFKNMEKKNVTNNYTVLNNEVYGITMRANISNLTSNIEMIITLNNLDGNATCTSWDGKGNLEWTTFGCETERIDSNTIKCSCSHLTFFAVLMSPVIDANAVAPYLESLTLISAIGCGISVFFLAIALFMHFLLRKAKSNQATKILINMFGALFLLNVSFLSNESVANSGDKNACVFIALLMHYSMLTSFTWFFIQALHMYLWLIRQNVTITNYMRKITVLGWGFSAPAIIAVVSVGGYNKVTLTASSGKIAQMCWITNPLIHYVLNTGYYIFVFIFTIGIFITILTRIIQSRHIRTTVGKRQTFRKQLMMVLSLFILFGLTWAVAFFSYGPMLIPSYYIFCALNSFQGFFLFLYYYHIHKDAAGHFSDDPKSSGSVTTIVPPNNSNNNAAENVYDEPH
ncbi:adhesion G-protein coupled receptor G1 isoform X2 [Danio rerio]